MVTSPRAREPTAGHRAARAACSAAGAAAGRRRAPRGAAAPDAEAARRRRRKRRRRRTATVDVVVVGAGFAGLTAARELVQRGPLGGRARGAQPRRRPRAEPSHRRRRGVRARRHVRRPDPGPHPRARRRARRRTRSRPTTTGENVYFADGDALDATATPARPARRRPTRSILADLATVVTRLERDVEGGAGRRALGGGRSAAEWDRQTLEHLGRREQRQPDASARSCRAATRPIFGAEPRELSLLFMLFYIAASGDERNVGHLRAQLQHARRRAGVPLRGRLAADLPTSSRAAARQRASCCARRCGGSSQGARRRHASSPTRSTVRAKRVIVAMPPVLAGRIDYSPGLPPRARRAHAAPAAGHADQGRRGLRPAVLARRGADRPGAVARTGR